MKEEIKIEIDGISKEKFISYEKVRQSGITNMFNVELVSQLSGLSKKDCRYIMMNYSQLMQIYKDVRKTKYPRTIGIVNLDDVK